MSTYFEHLQQLKLGLATNKPKEKKRIAPVSEKRKKAQRKYRKIVDKLAKEDNECSVKSPVCSFFMSGTNHKQKRSPGNFIKLENLERCCHNCNGYIEANVEWAKENGHQVSRFKK